ncbi:ABC transporter substrate-binding protein [Phyllobacterium sp. 0TCS1.6C]|uniref:ABC transporter substrate-binding protein n=1 Tax=unclassified Phyllobacterium TaxID=2638441 RepID=UPI0022645BD3|nr:MULTISPECIES: ABC transporter substrate-binding protein [unclassified Phyllobacterium]MCX8279457.1 ABC transporter substrate-binding protein [Phyllobacterium sp. 0TCS1.6C]MCX8292352.1 ABC transporter substrate-binding protein [Phyllobacterium sp. 0TCS1.6A]
MTLWRSALLALTLVLGSASAHAARSDLVLGVVLEPPHLDPTAGAAAAIDEIVYANVFEGLTRIGANGEVLPALAESWDISDDGRVYTFKLHGKVLFHDGTTFDGEDVKFSLDRARDAKSVNAQKVLFEGIENVEIVDPLTVRITLKQPDGDFLYNMGWGDAVIVAPETAATNKERPVGTGPFKFGNWAKGSQITLLRNTAYWGSQPALEKATFRIIPDPAAATAALLAGDVQAFPVFPSYETVPQFQADPRFKVVIGTTEGETVLGMNNAKPPFDALKVRQAIAHAIDRKALIDGTMFGFGMPIGSFFPPHHAAYTDLTAKSAYDPELAKKLLAEAGHPQGFKTTLKLPPPVYARRGGEIIAAQLAAIGIDAEIIPLEWAQWLDQVFKGKDYDLTIVSHTEPNDLNIFARDDYYFNYDNQAFKELIKAIAATSDQAQRAELYRKAQTVLADDVPAAFLFQLPKTGIWDAGIEGLWENGPIQANDLTNVRWAD